jgi:serine/threonine-protein kinase HipA
MQMGDAAYGDGVVRPWVEGLLPDNGYVRRTMAQKAGCSPNNPFELLAYYGRDCPGAVQICPPDELASVLAQEGSYEPIPKGEIGRRLKKAMSHANPTWMGDDEHWSLGGAQGKISLARINGNWNVCHGSAATTHLLKPGVEGFSLQSLDEYLCMRLASECGLQVAEVSYEEFGSVPAIVVERYDREVHSDGSVARLHQEDLCQALGYLPQNKYAPSASEALGLLKADATGRSTQDFVSALFFNYLIGATDAHAKNYSIMHLSGESLFLAPLYDVASILPYEKTRRGPRVAAMPIGREKRFGRLTGSNLDRFANGNELSADGCRRLMTELAERVCDAVGVVVDANMRVPGVDRIGPSLVRTIRANGEAMLLNMERDGRTLDTSLFSIIESGDIART